MKNKFYLNPIYRLFKSLEFKTSSIFGALIILTVVFVFIVSNMVKVQSGVMGGGALEQRSPTGTTVIDINSTSP